MQPKSEIPVFVYPRTLVFKLEDKSAHKQVLTLYNPYNFSVRYRVFGTSPEKFIISNPEGDVPSSYRVDIVIRHGSVSLSNCDVVDKFRIQLYDRRTKQVIGKHDVECVLVSNFSPADNSSSTESDNFKVIRNSGEYELHSVQPFSSSVQSDTRGIISSSQKTPNSVIILIGIICIAGLWCPTEKDESSVIGFRVSITLKLIFSFVLGMVTMVVLKP